MIFLDTHVVVWLYGKAVETLSDRGREAIELNYCLISPIVLLELQYLHETSKISVKADRIIQALEKEIQLGVDSSPFDEVVKVACRQTWTRDPFDRILVSQAKLCDAPLLTKDALILSHYNKAFWD